MAYPYNPVQHRFVRMRHDVDSQQMVYEVRSATGAWQEMKRFAAAAPLAGSYLELYAGTFEATAATRAVFDNMVAGGCAP